MTPVSQLQERTSVAQVTFCMTCMYLHKPQDSSTSLPFEVKGSATIMSEEVVQVILALDIGSSSIRCGAYKVIGASKVEQLDGCFASKVLNTVEPNTGKIELTTQDGTSLLDEIDSIVDTTLHCLRKCQTPTRVVGMGFASFCMNLIALDAAGIPVGKDATLSYACSSPTVADQCRRLKR